MAARDLYTGQWELHFRGDSEHVSGQQGSHIYKGPFEVRAHFHAQNLLTDPPSDGGQCTPGRKRAIVTGQIIGRRTDQGEIQGGGNVSAAPHLSRCRVPAIQVRVDDVELQVISPGKRLRVVLDVRISAGLSQGVHQPGNCKVNTRAGSLRSTTTHHGSERPSRPPPDDRTVGNGLQRP